MTEDRKIKLGQKVKDIVTGIEGIAVAHVRYLTGEDQIGIQPQAEKADKAPTMHYSDISRTEVVNDGVHIIKAPTKIGFNQSHEEVNE